MNVPFKDRAHAGRALARLLAGLEGRSGVQVLALPRGGVPVGFEVARALRAPLHVFLVRKLGVPGQEELALGAIATGGVRVLNRDVVDELRVPEEVIDAIAEREARELARRQQVYEGDVPRPPVEGSTVVLVDDGLATGSTMRAAVAALRKERPKRIVVAVPVAARATSEALERTADQVVCAATPEPFYAVGMWYENFAQTTDEEVRALLAAARHLAGVSTPRGS